MPKKECLPKWLDDAEQFLAEKQKNRYDGIDF